jgi:uroporphyrinogen-III synthase
MKTLYLGLDLPRDLNPEHTIHFPIIKIVPKPTNDLLIMKAFHQFEKYTHLIFTSKNGVSIFLNLAHHFGIQLSQIASKTLITVGKKTANRLKENGLSPHLIASEETAEGIIQMLSEQTLIHAFFFLPQSSLSRSVLQDWFIKKKILYVACPVYDTVANESTMLPSLANVDRIFFTSPSTIDAFLKLYGFLPKDKILVSIGPVTEKYLNLKLCP